MALTQTRAQIRANMRRFTDTGGVTALARHPDTDLNEYADRALASLHRLLTEAMPDQRILSTSPITTVSGTLIYSLPADFDHLISVDITASGLKSWLLSYEMHERPTLTDPANSFAGVPFAYRLRGSNIELLPTPSAGYAVTLWYVPTATQFASDAQLYDTISRLDDYLIAYGSRFVAVKDKNSELVNLCNSMMEELKGDIRVAARSRDKNSPARIVDESMADKWGRRARWRR